MPRPNNPNTTSTTSNRNAGRSTIQQRNPTTWEAARRSLSAEDADFGTPFSDTDVTNLQLVSMNFLIVAPPPTPPLGLPDDSRMSAFPSIQNQTHDDAVLLNTAYAGPGYPRFAVVHQRAVVKASTVEALLPAIQALDEVSYDETKADTRATLLAEKPSSASPPTSRPCPRARHSRTWRLCSSPPVLGSSSGSA